MENIINSGLYSLEPNFGDIFKTNSEFGVESVFEIVYSDNSIADWWMFGSGRGEGNVGIQFVAIPEFQGIGTAVGQQFSAALTGQMTVKQALSTSQHLVERTMRKARYPK